MARFRRWTLIHDLDSFPTKTYKRLTAFVRKSNQNCSTCPIRPDVQVDMYEPLVREVQHLVRCQPF